MSAAQRHDDLTIDTIESALRAIDADVSREKWARIGMALKAELGEAGFALFDAWSKTAARCYDAKECAATWKSINAGGGVNIATLIWEAQQNGWRFDDDRAKLDAAQIEKRRAEREAEQKAAEAEKRRQQGEAAKLANLTWEASTPAGDGHPYLQDKGVRAHGLGLGEWPLINDSGEVFRRLPDALLIPIMDAKNGKVISLQGILLNSDGGIDKRYLKHGRKRGGFHMIGTPPEAGQPLVFCEGYATGATIHELTGWCVIVTFDAPNLPFVAEIMREKFPQAAFIIAGDNDQFTTKQDGTPVNPGLEYGQRAAQVASGFLIVPKFADLAGEPTDWNDLAAREGEAVVRAQLLANPITSRPDTTGGDVVPATPANDNVDYFTPLPDVNNKGKPLATIENLAEIIDRLGVTARYNVIAKDTEIIIPGETFLSDTKRGSALARIKSQCMRFGMPTEPLGEYLLYLADKQCFNPVQTWIDSKPWDGVSRFQALLDTVETRFDFDRDLFAMLMRRWFISAAAAALKPAGFWSKGVLVFQGAQSLGKTSWFRALLPDWLRDLIKVGALIDPSNKDTIISAVAHWLVELGELDGTFNKADIARLKGFISQDVDQFRRPYAKVEEAFQRRTVFFASVNPEQFLADSTGNSRWWTVPVVGLNTTHEIDMQQLWAEVATWFRAGERWWLDRDEEQQLESANAKHQQADPVEERLQSRLDWKAPAAMWTWATATEVLIAVGIERPTKAEAAGVGRMMRRLNGDRGRRANGRNQVLCPPLLGQRGNDQPY